MLAARVMRMRLRSRPTRSGCASLVLTRRLHVSRTVRSALPGHAIQDCKTTPRLSRMAYGMTDSIRLPTGSAAGSALRRRNMRERKTHSGTRAALNDARQCTLRQIRYATRDSAAMPGQRTRRRMRSNWRKKFYAAVLFDAVEA